jgi:HAD superfamily hydrolase (TIGR01459 family)
MANTPAIITGLHEIAAGHDALICDVWGVLHNGTHAHGRAVDALRRFRAGYGPVVLLSNAPRPVADVVAQFQRLGVPEDCYDEIVTSGVAARLDIAKRAEGGRLALYHLGPERDRGIITGLPVDCVAPAEASVILCTGLFDDDTETPEDYREALRGMAARKLVMLCANPDIVVQRGKDLIYCAGALAALYRELGGVVVYYGKPYAPIYEPVLAAVRRIAGRDLVKPLAIGDGLETDIRGANNVGLEVLFIADGVHGEEVGEFTEQALARLLGRAGLAAKAAMRALVW